MRDSGVSSSSGDEDDVTPNGLSHMPTRGAVEVLRDINKWFRPPRIPFHTNPEWSDSDRFDPTIAELYAQHGWPAHFDGDAFEVGHPRRWAKERVRDDQEGPARKLEEAQESVANGREWVAHHEEKAAQPEALEASLVLQTAVAEVQHEEGEHGGARPGAAGR